VYGGKRAGLRKAKAQGHRSQGTSLIACMNAVSISGPRQRLGFDNPEIRRLPGAKSLVMPIVVKATYRGVILWLDSFGYVEDQSSNFATAVDRSS